MSVKYNFLFCVLLIFSFFISSAQSGQIGTNVQDHLLIKLANTGLYGAPEEEFDGTPYLNETFVAGDVYGNKDRYVGVPMRYNMYKDIIEFKQNELLYILDPEPRIKKVNLGNVVLVVEKYEFKGKMKYGYLTLLDSGKVMLMSKKVVNYTPGHAPKALESAATPAKYSKSADIFFYRTRNSELVKVDNLKNMIEGFPDRQEELSQFAKTEKISPRKEEELIKLVKYYNSLK